MENILITGGLGFIGANLVKHLADNPNLFIHNVDNLSLGETHFDDIVPEEAQSRIKTYIHDINDQKLIASILAEHDIQNVYHLAAESHVDRSISGPQTFYKANVMGTLSMVEACREHIEYTDSKNFRFLYVSTDEVFGDLGAEDPPFSDTSSYNPSSPYSASKAAADFIIKSWHRTFGFPGIITNCSNNFGPGQNKEKLIPTILNALLAGHKIPIYGSGQNIRDWLFVDTHVAYLEAIMGNGNLGQSYLIGGDMELTNLDLMAQIHRIFNEKRPNLARPVEEVFEFVADRKGHDRRYAIDSTTLKKQFPLIQTIKFEEALSQTIDFYIDKHD